MAFWGVELQPGKPYIHSFKSSPGRLRISQAILDPFSPYSGYATVQCKVGNKSPVFICLLHGGSNNVSCMLDIELEEKEDDVVLTNLDDISVHFSGFYSRNNGQSAGNGTVGNHGASSTSQAVRVKTEFNPLEQGRDPEYKDMEINGRLVRRMASGLVIENIRTSGNSNNNIAYHGSKVQVRYFGQIKSTGLVFESNYGSCVKCFTLGNGDVIKGLEDGINGMQFGDKRRLTIPPSMGYCGSKARSEVPADAWLVFERKDMAFWGVKLEKGKPYTHSYSSSLGWLRVSKMTLGEFTTGCYVDVRCKVGNRSPVSLCLFYIDSSNLSSNLSCALDIELEEKEDDVVFEVIGCETVHLTGFYLGHNGQSGNVVPGKVENFGACPATQVVVKNVLEIAGGLEYKDTVVNGRHVRTMASGLVIEDIQTSTKRAIAYHGCWVGIRYLGQIRSTGYVFESNYDQQWKKCFRLGQGDVIKGLDDGINGMHVGDRRRLTVPPSMG